MKDSEHRKRAASQIQSLLLVLSLSIICAVGFAGFFLYYHGPAGTYQFKNIMISPDLLNGFSYNGRNPATGKAVRYELDKIEFLSWDSQKRQWSRVAVNPEQYRVFYDKLFNEMSIGIVGEEVVEKFQYHPPSRLMLDMKMLGEGPTKASKSFQEVQFSSQGDFFRVELLEQTSTNQWIYFIHAGIKDEASAIFTQQLEAQ